MKKLLIILLIIPAFVCAQEVQEYDFVAPLNEGVAAVEKNNSWGFINGEGILVIPFRNDLVLSVVNGSQYPIFKNNRCLIFEIRNGVKYFGYIDKTGNIIITPEFLNASNFNNNTALALKLGKDTVGRNDILNKNIVYYRYFEVTIDPDGNVKNYLNPKGTSIVLDRKFLKSTPKITSKIISNNLVATMNQNKKWVVTSINP